MRKPPHETALADRSPAKGPHRSAALTGPEAGVQSDGRSGSRPSPGAASERTCILSRRTASRDELIRLALGPDGEVAPDVRARAPGRGAWIGVDRATLDAAQAKGKLKAALARAFKTGEAAAPADLGARIEAALAQAALDRLGLEARAGSLLLGAERIETAARRGDVVALLHAADSSAEGRRKLDQAWRVGLEEEGSGRQGLVLPAARTILSLALGRENVVHVAVIDRAAAARVDHALSRWRAFIGPDVGLSAATAETPGASVRELKKDVE
jgi:uncharacterized protein